jgi:hypothetical protein
MVVKVDDKIKYLSFPKIWVIFEHFKGVLKLFIMHSTGSTFSNQTFPIVKQTKQSGTTKTINKQDYEGINSNTFGFF